MKLSLFLALSLLVSAFSAEARIGETLEQCKARYGPVSAHEQGSDLYVFEKNGFMVAITFFQGNADGLIFKKAETTALGTPKEMSENEIQNFCAANAGSSEWRKSETSSMNKMWATIDGTRFAIYQPFDNRLMIVTKEFLARQAAENAAKENKAQEGF
jgi:hypothetical protein